MSGCTMGRGAFAGLNPLTWLKPSTYARSPKKAPSPKPKAPSPAPPLPPGADGAALKDFGQISLAPVGVQLLAATCTNCPRSFGQFLDASDIAFPPFPAYTNFVSQWDGLQLNYYYYFQSTPSLKPPIQWSTRHEGLWPYSDTNSYFGLELSGLPPMFVRVWGIATNNGQRPDALAGQPGAQPAIGSLPYKKLRRQIKGQPFVPGGSD